MISGFVLKLAGNLKLILLTLVFAGTTAAAGGIDVSGLSAICTSIQTAVPIVAFSMILLGGLIYAFGQVLGAETRARAVVWGTALLLGGVIGILIAASAPLVVGLMAGLISGSTITAVTTCSEAVAI